MGLFPDIFGPSAEQKAEDERKRKCREDEQKDRLDRLNRTNLAYQESIKNDLQSVRCSYNQEVRLNDEQNREFYKRQSEITETHNSQLQQTLADNHSRLAELQETINLEKANRRTQHLKEKADMINNYAAQNLVDENARATLNMTSEKRINEERKQILEKEEMLMKERKRMAEKLTEKEEFRMAQRLALEHEKNATALTTNQIITDFAVHNSQLDKVHQSAVATLVDAYKKDERNFADNQKLKSVKRMGDSINTKVYSLFNKFDVLFNLKNENELKKAARIAPGTIRSLETEVNSLVISLENLHQDAKRATLVKNVSPHLSCFKSLLTRLDCIVKDIENIKLEYAGVLMECLHDMVNEINITVTTINNIPHFDNETDFMQEGLRVMKNLDEIPNPTISIESTSAGSGKLEQMHLTTLF